MEKNDKTRCRDVLFEWRYRMCGEILPCEMKTAD